MCFVFAPRNDPTVVHHVAASFVLSPMRSSVAAAKKRRGLNDDGIALFDTQATGSKSKMKIMEVYHFSQQNSYRFFDTTSAINYLANEFSFESFTPETIFYVLPVFEDILRAGQLKVSQKVRRSNYSYQIIGTKIRDFPKPTQDDPKKMYIMLSSRQQKEAGLPRKHTTFQERFETGMATKAGVARY